MFPTVFGIVALCVYAVALECCNIKVSNDV